MTFAELKTELKARGFDYLSDTRAGQYINRAYHETCEMADWPFLRATTTGTAPLTISDMRQVIFVEDTTNNRVLEGVDERSVRNADPDITATGDPEYWWLSGTTTLNVYPPNTTPSLRVVYYEVPDDLSGSNSPTIPTRYHLTIVDRAACHAYKDQDNWDAAQAAEADWLVQIQQMQETLLLQNYQNSQDIIQTWTYDY